MIETGKQNASRQTLIGLARKLRSDFDLIWLRPYVTPSAAVPEEWLERHLRASGSQTVALVGKVAAGRPIEPVPQDETITVPSGMLRHGKRAFALYVEGTSMIESLIQHGDVVLIQECPEPANGAVVVAEIKGEVTLKTWKQQGNRVKLIPANPDYPEIEVPASQVKCVGEMIGLLRFVK